MQAGTEASCLCRAVLFSMCVWHAGHVLFSVWHARRVLFSVWPARHVLFSVWHTRHVLFSVWHAKHIRELSALSVIIVAQLSDPSTKCDVEALLWRPHST